MRFNQHNFAYRRAKRLVQSTLDSPKALLDLVNSAKKKVNGGMKKSIQPLTDPLKDCYRLIQAYAKGTYRKIGLDDISLIVAAIIYFVMPLDALPDFIAGLGFTDDAAVLAWTFNKVKTELERFRQWETDQQVTEPFEQDLINDESDST